MLKNGVANAAAMYEVYSSKDQIRTYNIMSLGRTVILLCLVKLQTWEVSFATMTPTVLLGL